MSSPSGRRVLRAWPRAVSGSPSSELGRRGEHSRCRVDHDQIWRDGRQEEADGQEGGQGVEEVVKAVLAASPAHVTSAGAVQLFYRWVSTRRVVGEKGGGGSGIF